MQKLRGVPLAVSMACAFQLLPGLASIPRPSAPKVPAATGGLQVIVNAPGAKVFLDGQYMGELTPPQVLTLPDLPAGDVQVRVEAPGFQARALTYTLQAGAWTHAFFQLVRLGGEPAAKPTAAAQVPLRPGYGAPLLPPDQDGARSSVAGVTRNAQGLWEITLWIGAVSIDLVQLPAGRYRMGSDAGDQDEMPVHEVSIRKPFWMGKYPVTQAQWQAVRGFNPSKSREAGPEAPVENVSYHACEGFIDRLNELQSAWTFRLPSEAEWEFACRAGSGAARPALSPRAGRGAGGTPRPVGQQPPNAWGLHDMLGNVWQWCRDSHHANYKGAPSDGTAWTSDGGPRRPARDDPSQPLIVIRGCAWDTPLEDVRVTERGRAPASATRKDLGFRLVCLPR